MHLILIMGEVVVLVVEGHGHCHVCRLASGGSSGVDIFLGLLSLFWILTGGTLSQRRRITLTTLGRLTGCLRRRRFRHPNKK